MRIFRYLFKEVNSSFMAVALIVLLIFISSRFVKYLARAANGSFPSDILLWIMLYRLPGFIEVILPLALFIGVMLACGRLYVDSEMIVLQACGVSKTQLLLYVQGPAIAVTCILIAFTTWLTPLGWDKYYTLWNNPDNFNGISTLVEGSFKSIGNDKTVIYTAALNKDKTKLKDVFVLRHLGPEEGNQVSIIRADEALVVNHSAQERYVELLQGSEYTGLPGQKRYAVSEFSEYGQLVQVGEQKDVVVDEANARSTQYLLSTEKKTHKERAMLQWRLALPWMVPIVAILALALSETNHRRGRYTKILPGIVLYMLYFGLLITVRSNIEKGRFPELSLWYVHAVFLSLSLLLVYPPKLSKILPKKKKAVAA